MFINRSSDLVACRELTVELTKTVRKNGTLTVHSVIIPKKKVSEELSLREAVRDPAASVIKGYLTQYAVPKSYAFNLLKEQGKQQSVKSVTHIKNRYGIIMCTDELHLPHTGIPPEVIRHLRVNDRYEFLPIVVEDLMQTRLKDLTEVTDELKSVSFTYIYNPVTFGKLRFLLQIEATLKQFLTLGFTEKDLDEIRGVFADTNLYLLCATMAIGSIHVCCCLLLASNSFNLCLFLIVVIARFFIVQKRCKFLENTSIYGWFIKTHCTMAGIFTNYCFFISFR